MYIFLKTKYQYNLIMEQISSYETIQNPGVSNFTPFFQVKEEIKKAKNIKINEYENPFKKEEYSLDKKLIHKMVQKINKNKIKKEKKTEEDKKNENIQDTFQRFESVKIFDKKISQKKEFNNQKRGCYSSSKKSNEINTIDNFRFKSKDKSNNSEDSINIIFNDIINIKSFDSNEKNEDSKKESNKSKIISKYIENLKIEKFDIHFETNNKIKNKEQSQNMISFEENIIKYYNQNRRIIRKTDNFIEALQNLSDNITLNNAIILAKLDTIQTSISYTISNTISYSISKAISSLGDKLVDAIKIGFSSLKEKKLEEILIKNY